MVLIEYIVINNFIAEQKELAKNSISELCIANEYVLEKYKRDTGNGNYDFQYKIYQDNQLKQCIKIGKWKIENLRSDSGWVPKTLHFDLVDPNGKSSADKTLPYSWIYNDSTTYIHAPFTGHKGINNMLQQAKEASDFTYWQAFIKSRFEKHIAHTFYKKIADYEVQIKALTTKLENIQSILNTK